MSLRRFASLFCPGWKAESDGNLYIDLANEDWEFIQCTSNGWKLLSNSLVKFIRSRGLLSLRAPIPGDAFDLRQFINVIDGEEWLEGTAGKPLEHLESMSLVTDRIERSRTWPQSARGLRASLKRIKSMLEKTGINIEFSKIKYNGHYPVRLCRKHGETTFSKSPATFQR